MSQLSFIDFKCASAQPLSAERELHLAKTHDCGEAGRLLMQSQMKLARDMSKKYFARGVSEDDFFQEAMLGVVKAVEGFDPDKGYRLSTYAHWKIKDRLFETLRCNQSIVTVDGSTFRLQNSFRKAERWVNSRGGYDLFTQDVKMAERLNVSVEDVQETRMRLEQDESLDAPMGGKYSEDGESKIDFVTDGQPTHVERYEEDEFQKQLKGVFRAVCADVCKNQRELDVFIKRRLVDDPVSRLDLAKEYGVSQQRIAQIEQQVFDRVKKRIESRNKNLHRTLTNA